MQHEKVDIRPPSPPPPLPHIFYPIISHSYN